MAFTVQHIRSTEADRRPSPQDLVDGQIAINMHQSGPGMFFRTTEGTLVKVGPSFIGGVEPIPTNYTPLSIGEQWLDTSTVYPVLRIWDGTDWLAAKINPADLQIILNDGALEGLRTNVTPAQDCSYDLGSPTNRWANIFTCDIDLSNEGGKNDVDGTWGSYVIQEGEDDLFLLNRRNGKRYKFMLQEVE